MTKLLDGGDDAGRMNIILVGDGYTTDDRDLFERHAVQLSKQVQAESWYRRGLLNVHAEWITSEERAPTAPTGKPNKTYFRSYYGGDRAAHVISGDDEAVTRLCAAWGDLGWPWHAIVIVNSTLYGGKGGGQGGGMCWTYTDSRNPARWTSCALHELGHSLFGLEDEYGGRGKALRASEPKEPNITLDVRGAKWRHIVTGAVEGAAGFDEGIYRPTRNCRMRTLNGTWQYCAVCADAARRTLEGYLSDEPEKPEPEPVRGNQLTIIGIRHQGMPKAETLGTWPDDSAGCMAAVQFLLKRQFG